MATLPSAPTRQTSFTDYSTNYPGQPAPGDKLDAEFDRINGALAALIPFIGALFQVDGTLKPSTVSSQALTPDLLASLADLDAARAIVTQASALKWAEYIAGPVVDSSGASAYINSSPFPEGLYSDAVEGSSGGLFSAKYWAIYATSRIAMWADSLAGRLAGGQVNFMATTLAVQLQPFVGNGALKTFALKRLDNGAAVTPGQAAQLIVAVNGVLQLPGTDYSVTDTNITFTTAPATNAKAWAVWLSTVLPPEFQSSGLLGVIDGGTFPAADDAGPSNVLIDGGTF